MLLSSQFQGFCRDLHTESIDHIINAVQPVSLYGVLRAEWVLHRKLDQGNPNPGNIGADFNRLGLSFWDAVRRKSADAASAVDQLELLTRWRNAIAHQEFSGVGTSNRLQLKSVNQWRKCCGTLARLFDEVMRDYIESVIGRPPWT